MSKIEIINAIILNGGDCSKCPFFDEESGVCRPDTCTEKLAWLKDYSEGETK